MAEIEAAQIAQIAQQVKSIIQAESQGVGEIGVVTSLDGVVSIPALKEGDVVVEVPLELFYLEADEALKKVDEAVKKAEDTALHPIYVGEDNYVYKWNAKTQAYEKTDIYVRGEAFKISRIYTSVINMEGDTQHGLKEGDFVLINTNDVEDPDNARIYAVGSDGKFRFVVDMSGAIGFTGKTPQVSVGTVVVGDNRNDAVISMSGDGEDADGNPKYKLNFRIPALHLSDLSEEEIGLLQSPAAEMIEKLEQTDGAVKEAEAAREQAEDKRAEAELERSAAEASRKAEETLRISGEASRAYNEQQRQDSEAQRVEGEALRREAESLRLTAETERRASENSREEEETLREEAEAGRQEAEEYRVDEFARLKTESEAATGDARDTADHPTYIGEDNYVYKWNRTAQTYDKTAIYVRGEAFSIKKVYASVDGMYADTDTSFREGDFCLINTGDVENPENAQLFVRTSVGSWDFLVDMSGAIGFTGKTPQMFIGTVSIGSGKDSAAVTLTPSGTDTDGNPMYSLNYVIPCLAYEDLTEEQIADLQRPATDMIAQLKATDDAVKAAEAARADAENVRVASENARVSAENTRKSNEDIRLDNENERKSAEEERKESETSRKSSERTRSENEEERKTAETERKTSETERKTSELARVSNEDARIANESTRQTNEDTRMTNENGRETAEDERQEAEDIRKQNEETRTANEERRKEDESLRQETDTARKEDYSALREDMVTATADASEAALKARNLPKIQNGTWWLYDIEQGVYVDTGYSVSSDYVLTKESVERVLTGDIETHTHTHLIYYAQVYDEAPDFSTLSTWTGTDGLVHDFVPGNDIYVKNDTEPTGYANYKLAVSAEGNVWVRIPQVAAGWRVVLVRE